MRIAAEPGAQLRKPLVANSPREMTWSSSTDSGGPRARIGKKRKKKASNDDWQNPNDPDAEITKLKDGRTHLVHKVEHAVDMDSGVAPASKPRRNVPSRSSAPAMRRSSSKAGTPIETPWKSH